MSCVSDFPSQIDTFTTFVDEGEQVTETLQISTITPYTITLQKIPKGPSRNINGQLEEGTVYIQGFREIEGTPSASNQYNVDYNTGVVTFGYQNAGDVVTVSYQTAGNLFTACEINKIQDAITKIEQNLGTSSTSIYVKKAGDTITGNIVIESGSTLQVDVIFSEGCLVTQSKGVALGWVTSATASAAVAIGYDTLASGYASFAANTSTIASGDSATALGDNTIASGGYSFASGSYSVSSGAGSHTEGTNTIASNVSAHAEGSQTEASGADSHSQGYKTIASGDTAFAGGYESSATAFMSFAFGNYLTSSHEGAYLFGDSLNHPIVSDEADQFKIRYDNGFKLVKGKTGGGDSTNYELKQATVNTTDATVTVLQTIAIPTDSVVLIETKVLGRRTGGSAGSVGDCATYVVRARFKDISGTVTVHDLEQDFISEDQGGWDATLVVNGTNVEVKITGAANNDITWNTTTEIQKLS